MYYLVILLFNLYASEIYYELWYIPGILIKNKCLFLFLVKPCILKHVLHSKFTFLLTLKHHSNTNAFTLTFDLNVAVVGAAQEQDVGDKSETPNSSTVTYQRLEAHTIGQPPDLYCVVHAASRHLGQVKGHWQHPVTSVHKKISAYVREVSAVIILHGSILAFDLKKDIHWKCSKYFEWRFLKFKNYWLHETFST